MMQPDGQLEPMIAHGSRMSLAGILRPGNEFPRAKKSNLVVLKSDEGPALERYFGKWDSTFKRFTTNLTSTKIRIIGSDRQANGIQCILHWVERKDMIRSDRGSVCQGDGWPVELWNAFLSELDNLPSGTIGEKLSCFLDSDLKEENSLVSKWRSRVREGRIAESPEESIIDKSWVPVPASLVIGNAKTKCIFSWSPGARFYPSISEALSSKEAIEKKPNLENQAKYYVECTLAALHGVRFGSNDHVEDMKYTFTDEVQRVQKDMVKLEQERIADRNLGFLDRFGKV